MKDDAKDQEAALAPTPQAGSALKTWGAELAGRGLALLQRVEALPEPGPVPFSPFENSLGMRFVCLPPGRFTMGSPPLEPGRKPYENPHRVILSQGFYLQITPVTVAHWRAFAQATGHVTRAERKGGAFALQSGRWVQKEGCFWDKACAGQTEDHPVTCISWHEAREFTQWLTLTEALPYRLPTEAEWEYACRAGTWSRFSFGEDEKALGEYAWYWPNSGRHPHPVAQKRPNAWGLYDMHGNVWELCEDRCEWRREMGRVGIETDTYVEGITDPLCQKGRYRIARGGDWLSPARSCRAAKRLICAPKSPTTVRGFRLALSP